MTLASGHSIDFLRPLHIHPHVQYVWLLWFNKGEQPVNRNLACPPRVVPGICVRKRRTLHCKCHQHADKQTFCHRLINTLPVLNISASANQSTFFLHKIKKFSQKVLLFRLLRLINLHSGFYRKYNELKHERAWNSHFIWTLILTAKVPRLIFSFKMSLSLTCTCQRLLNVHVLTTCCTTIDIPRNAHVDGLQFIRICTIDSPDECYKVCAGLPSTELYDGRS